MNGMLETVPSENIISANKFTIIKERLINDYKVNLPNDKTGIKSDLGIVFKFGVEDTFEAKILESKKWVVRKRNPFQCKQLIVNDDSNNNHKYWAQRYRLFLKFDEGIQLDEESWYSVTPEKVARHVALKCKCDILIDGFCGAGGNTIQFALTCQRVIAVDIDHKKIELARNNARVYGVEHKIDFIVGDFFEVVPMLKADVIFLSPPWGGPEYANQAVFNLRKMGRQINGLEVFETAKKVTENIAYYVPRNTNVNQLATLAGKGGNVIIEENLLNSKTKSLTAYYGNFAMR